MHSEQKKPNRSSYLSIFDLQKNDLAYFCRQYYEIGLKPTNEGRDLKLKFLLA